MAALCLEKKRPPRLGDGPSKVTREPGKERGTLFVTGLQAARLMLSIVEVYLTNRGLSRALMIYIAGM